MKKLAAALLAGSFAVLSFGSVADAYPPFEKLVTVDKPKVAPSETVIATANCVGLEEVTFDLGGTTGTGTCNGTDDGGATVAALATFGTASAALVAPATPGDFIVTATGSFSVDLGSTELVVVEQPGAPPAPPTDVLPATGSGIVSLTTGVALGLLAVGIGLFFVATLRRRQPIID